MFPGGVFLKLYLDRHRYEPFLTLANLFLYGSPCFAFSTCRFDLFAVRAAAMSVTFGAEEDSAIASTLGEVSINTIILFVHEYIL